MCQTHSMCLIHAVCLQTLKVESSVQGKIFRADKFISLCLFAYLGLQFPHINVNFALSYLICISSDRKDRSKIRIETFYFLSVIQTFSCHSSESMKQCFTLPFYPKYNFQNSFLVVMSNIYKIQFMSVFCLPYNSGWLKMAVNSLLVSKHGISFSSPLKLG